MGVDGIRVVGVVGAGTMGAGVAQYLAQEGYGVVVYNRSREGIERMWRQVARSQSILVGNGLITREIAEESVKRIRATTDIEELGDADLVNENVAESLDVKREVFRRLDEVCRPGVILSTDTSGLSITAIGSATRRPELVVGMHFWNPPEIIPLVEVVKGEKTSDWVCDLVMELLRRLGKAPVLCRRDIPGFIGNRIQLAMIREALNIYEMGVATPEEIDTAVQLGFGLRLPALGPLMRMDSVGLDLVTTVAGYLLKELSNASEVPPIVKEKVARGDLGMRTGRGIYDYGDKQPSKIMDEVMSKWIGILRVVYLDRKK